MHKSEQFSTPINLHPYLEEIAKRLYNRHAAIMVGAGFSRNTVHPNSDHKNPPEWTDLGDMFYAALYGTAEPISKRYMAIPTLAHEVESAIGRPALEQMLREAIPDLEHEPTTLHTALLSLPWEDVFTTNYDTLLERASRTITTQRYHSVTNQEELVFAERPRIVKLHGSFTSDVPLVITDEDYRCYPENFAPFLNTVRQCLLENTLCLIGFSGTDPNFLQWIGWLHDHIGKTNSPRLYLIGAFNFTSSQMQLLERRNIAVVDMSLCDGVESGDHQSALLHFIQYLTNKRSQYENWKWPLLGARPKMHPDRFTVEDLSNIITQWKHQRQSYPGWVIVPEEQRKYLRDSMHQVLSFWESKDKLNLSDLPLFVDLVLAFELIWRSEKCLYPIFDPQITFIQSVLTRYWELEDIETATELSEQSNHLSQHHKPTQSELKFYLHHISLAVMRYYREEGMQEDWKAESKRLENVKNALSPEHKAQYHYELALCALYELNSKRCQDAIEEWEINESLPFWEAKRAGLLAEVGRTDEAKSILQNSLKAIRVRSNLKPIAGDYSLISQEAHVMMLLQYLEVLMWQSGNVGDIHIDDNDARWSVFHQFKCDPKSELARFEQVLSQPNADRSEISERPAFDIGRTSRTYRALGPDFGAIVAYTFLHFCEDVGMPLIFSRSATKGVLPRISTHSPHLTVVSLIRLGDRQPDVLDSIFSRYALSRFDADFVDTLVEQFLNALDLAKSDIASAHDDLDHNFGVQIARVVPAVLSRLCSKCSSNSRVSILEFLHYVYRSDTRTRYSGIRILTGRLLKTFTTQERIKAIPRLLDFPVVSHSTPQVTREYVNPFRFLDLAVEWIGSIKKPPSDKVAVWLANAASTDPHVRQWAVFTLASLHRWSLLSKSQESTFAVALWDQCDSCGWPINTGLHRFQILGLPYTAPHNPQDLFRQYVLETPILENTASGFSWNVLHEIQRSRQQLPWSKEDVLSILGRCMDWWDRHKDTENLNLPSRPFLFDRTNFMQGVMALIDAATSVIQFSGNLDLDCDSREKIQGLIRDFTERGVYANRFASVCLTLFPDQKSEVLNFIRLGLASSDVEAMEDSFQAIRALLDVAAASTKQAFKADLSDLLLTAGQIVFWRRSVGLPDSIDLIAHAIKNCPEIFGEDLENLVLEGLRQIIVETVIHVPSGRLQNMAVDEPDFALRLAVRLSAAHLAFVLYKHYTKIECAIPEIVSEWEIICRSNDEFAEIRNNWIDQ